MKPIPVPPGARLNKATVYLVFVSLQDGLSSIRISIVNYGYFRLNFIAALSVILREGRSDARWRLCTRLNFAA